MPPADDDVTILVCDCGKRLRAPGARPGRVGKCPACGGTLRFPGEEPAKASAKPKVIAAETPAPRPKPEKPKRATSAIPMNASGPGAEDTRAPGRAGTVDPQRRAEVLEAARQVGGGGILRLPRKSKSGLKDALLYPIWDFAGLTWIGFLPLMLGPPFLAVFYLIPVVMKGGDNAILGPFAFPMIVFFALGLGYLGQVFTSVLAESSAGSVNHPRWPDIDFGGIVASLFNWVCGLVIGLSIGSIPAIRYWKQSEEHGLGDRVIASALVATGLFYGLMSAASLLLHGDLMALNPWMIVKAIFRAGFRYWQTVLLAIAFVALGVLGVELVDRTSGTLMMVPAMWLAWAVIVYGGLVVSRSLGMVCFIRREQIGWFPHRERWGVSMDGVDPSMFRDKDGRKPL